MEVVIFYKNLAELFRNNLIKILIDVVVILFFFGSSNPGGAMCMSSKRIRLSNPPG